MEHQPGFWFWVFAILGNAVLATAIASVLFEHHRQSVVEQWKRRLG
jgi:hypothetical protein